MNLTYFIFQREKWEINCSRKKTHIPWTSPTFTRKKQLIIVITVAKVSLIKKDYAGIFGKCMNLFLLKVKWMKTQIGRLEVSFVLFKSALSYCEYSSIYEDLHRFARSLQHLSAKVFRNKKNCAHMLQIPCKYSEILKQYDIK